jgi:hypothetical protein
MVYKIIFIMIFGFSNFLNASPTECNRQARENFTSEKKICDSKKSDDKKNCMKEARDKLKSKNSECRQALVDCTSIARESYKTALSSCRTMNGNDKKNCTETAKKEFNSIEIECKKK